MRFSTIAFILPMLLLGAGCMPKAPQQGSSAPVSADLHTVGDADSKVDLSGRGLKKVPEDIFQRADVTSLDLSDNALEGALPAEIRHMRALQVLDVSGNLMTGVPAEIGQLQELRVLDLSDNRLTGLPYELGQLQNLELLDLSGNAYSQIDLSLIEKTLPETTVIRR